ncbi:MAG: large conductance mechanosensitive channel protein MscL [Clostridiales bacterium]|nr:large conductance mechanosensitive channel protein MscL [Clostridiales bacterium]
MKKFFKEFKTFITRGSVIDLAVGMIIGAAFTAIVSALVNNIFTPLINCIPMGDINGLITMLVAKDATGAVTKDMALVDMTKSIYIDWGAFIMAIINFIITAFVLFLIIKAINTVRESAEKFNGVEISKEQKKELKAQGMSRKQMKEYVLKQKEEEAAKAAAEAEANKPETTEQILNDIRELLKALQPAQAATIQKSVDKVAGKADK